MVRRSRQFLRFMGYAARYATMQTLTRSVVTEPYRFLTNLRRKGRLKSEHLLRITCSIEYMISKMKCNSSWTQNAQGQNEYTCLEKPSPRTGNAESAIFLYSKCIHFVFILWSFCPHFVFRMLAVCYQRVPILSHTSRSYRLRTIRHLYNIRIFPHIIKSGVPLSSGE